MPLEAPSAASPFDMVLGEREEGIRNARQPVWMLELRTKWLDGGEEAGSQDDDAPP